MNKEFNPVYWDELKTKLKREFPMLTNADLHRRHGTQEDMLHMIALKLGKTSNELQKIIAGL